MWGVIVVLVGVAAVTMGMVVRDRRPAPSPRGKAPTLAVDPASIVPGAVEPAATESALGCERVEFPGEFPVSEASGAVYLADGGSSTGGAGSLLVVGDSGNGGRYIEIDGASGQILSRGRFQMDRRASDDFEGLAVRGGVVHGITSSGWVRHWTWDGERYGLVEPAYAIAPAGSPQVCSSPFESNCGPNYEGLCLRDGSESGSESAGNGLSPSSRCLGFAVAKGHGTLYCVVATESGRLRVDPDHALRVLPPATATGCHFDAEGSLWVGSNLFGGNRILRLRDWHDLEQVRVEAVDARPGGFPEALAVGRDGAVYSFSDTSSRTSGASKFVCQ